MVSSVSPRRRRDCRHRSGGRRCGRRSARGHRRTRRRARASGPGPGPRPGPPGPSGLRRVSRSTSLCDTASLLEQPLGAAKVGFGQRQLALRRGDAGPRFGQRGGERPRVDGEQQLALADDLAVGEVDADDLAGDARAHLDAAAGLEPADIIVPLIDLALDGCRDRHHGGRRSSGWGGVAGPEGDGRGKQDQRRADDRGALPQRARGELGAQRLELRRRPATLVIMFMRGSFADALMAARMLRTISSYWSGLKPAERKSATSSPGTVKPIVPAEHRHPAQRLEPFVGQLRACRCGPSAS